MHVPGAFLRHVVSVETYLGPSGNGPRYAPPVDVRVFLNQTTSLAADRSETTGGASSLIARLDRADVITAESRVTHGGRQYRVVGVTRNDDGGLGAWQHLRPAPVRRIRSWRGTWR